jgi:hypothetical protein
MKVNTSYFPWVAAFLVSGAALSSAADSHKESNAPGFRPESEFADTFVEHLDSSRIAVLPTVIRTRTTVTFSEASQKAVVSFLKAHKLGLPSARKTELDMGELKGQYQFDWFQNDRIRLGEIVKTQSGADYYMALEYLVPESPSGEIAVFGVHIYVLEANGENAFSFLLNSHHTTLVEAGLKSADSSNEGREALVLKGTDVALDALLQQIEQARHGKSQ